MWRLTQKAFFGQKILAFKILVPLEGFAPLEIFLATPLISKTVETLCWSYSPGLKMGITVFCPNPPLLGTLFPLRLQTALINGSISDRNTSKFGDLITLPLVDMSASTVKFGLEVIPENESIPCHTM